MNNLVKVNLHGELGKLFHESWELSISSVAEALNAIQTFMNGAFYKYLSSKEQKGAFYRVLINGEDFISEEPLDDGTKPERVKKSNLIANIEDLKTIDVIPLIQGSGKIAAVIVGALLIIAGAAMLIVGMNPMLGIPIIMAGVGLLAAGIAGLISKPPDIGDFGEQRTSYLFDGPINVTDEGGPIPVGYGRLLVGSQVVAQTYLVSDVSLKGLSTNYRLAETPVGRDSRVSPGSRVELEEKP